MLSIVICDDLAEHAGYAEQLIKNSVPNGTEYKTAVFQQPEELVENIRLEKLRPDIAVLDIEMPEIDGIELAGRIHSCLPECKIIFLSSYAKFASAVYRRDHIWFILKSGALEYMPEAIAKAIDELKTSASPSLLQIHTRGNTQYIPVDEVLYLERNRHSTMVISKESKHIVSTHPDILTENCADSFIRCHQSFWVNIKAIKELDKMIFVLVDGTHIPLSRSYSKSARARFFDLRIEQNIK